MSERRIYVILLLKRIDRESMERLAEELAELQQNPGGSDERPEIDQR